jgi:transglutaminase-like putative cysteine protease
MKLKRLTFLLLTFLFIFVLSEPFLTLTTAAAAPSVKEKEVTLYTDSDTYKIKYNNVADDATLKFKSSKRSVVTIKKSKVTPKGPGKATVTIKVKQNGKSYTLKVKFTVLDASQKQSSKPDYDALALERVAELKKSAVDKGNTIFRFEGDVLQTSDDVTNKIFSQASKYYSSYFSLCVNSLDILRSEQEYLDMFPGISTIVFDDVRIYKNTIAVKVTVERKGSSFNSDEFVIDCVLSNGNTSYLTSSQKALYDKVLSLAKSLKGKDEYTTVKNIHDYLVLNIAYPSSYSGDAVHTLDYALNKGVCVCDGYSKAFYFLCKASGIDAILLSGDAVNSSGNSESHAWNKVKINDKWYSIDVTWDDPFPDVPGQVKTNYFLITDKDISINHFWDNTGLPVADSTDLGIIYSTYGSLPSVSGSSETIDYISSKVSGKLGDSFDVTFEFVEKTGSKAITTKVQDLLKGYHNSYGCGYSYSTESAGFYGTYYKVRIYR